jgi:hypothetical protein
MKRSFGNGLMATGLSASLLAAGACVGEAEPAEFASPPTTEAPTTNFSEMDPAYYASHDQEWNYRLIDVRDQSQSSRSSLLENEAKPLIYAEASEMIRRSTLGEVAITFSEPLAVELPYDASAELCAVEANGTNEQWRTVLDRIKEEARDEINQLMPPSSQGAEYDADIFDFGFEVCHVNDFSNNEHEETEVLGEAGPYTDVSIYSTAEEVIAHEIWHERGLGHANALTCRAEAASPVMAQPPESDTCRATEGGDRTNAMGNLRSDERDALSGYHLALLGLLEREQIVDVTESGNYELDALLNDDGGPTLLRIPARGNWLPRMINEGAARREDNPYISEPQEYFTFELSTGITITDRDIDPLCYEMSDLDMERSDMCHPREVSIKAHRTAEHYATRNRMPETIVLDLDPDTDRVGAGDEMEGEVIFEHDGVEVELEQIESDESLDGTGAAQLEITIPE